MYSSIFAALATCRRTAHQTEKKFIILIVKRQNNIIVVRILLYICPWNPYRIVIKIRIQNPQYVVQKIVILLKYAYITKYNIYYDQNAHKIIAVLL